MAKSTSNPDRQQQHHNSQQQSHQHNQQQQHRVPLFIPHINGGIGGKIAPSSGPFKEKEIQLAPSNLPTELFPHQTGRESLTSPKTILAEVHQEPYLPKFLALDPSDRTTSEMTVYSILATTRNSKPNGLVNASLTNSLAKIFRSPEKDDDVRLNIEKSEIPGSDTNNNTNASEETVTNTEETTNNAEETSINDTIISKETTVIDDTKKADSESSKMGSTSRASSLPTPETNASSVPSPDWTTKIINSEFRVQASNNNMRSTSTTHGNRQASNPSPRQSTTSRYSSFEHPVEKLTDLRKILNPEVEKRDFETVFKAHWETFMDCRCFECTFNNAAKLVTAVVLFLTFFLTIKALINIFQR